jgi:hypothetical protein
MYLIILLKRYGINPNTGEFIMVTNKIDLDYELNIQGTDFILEGFILKDGGKDGGHYTYIKIIDRANYYVHDDSRVYLVLGDYNTNDYYKTNATILLYKKVI